MGPSSRGEHLFGGTGAVTFAHKTKLSVQVKFDSAQMDKTVDKT